MKQFYSALLIVVAIPTTGSAQFLTENSATTGPLLTTEVTSAPISEWSNEGDRVYGHIPNAKLATMRNFNNALISYFHDSLVTDASFSPVWHGEYFSEKAASGPVMKFGIECDFNEQRAHLSVIANDLSPLLDHLMVNNQDFLAIRPNLAGKDETPYFEYDLDSAHAKTWLVTIGKNPLPFIPVTRKEYLNEARTELNGIRNNMIADLKQRMPLRSQTEQDADKQASLNQLASLYSGMDLQIRTKMFLQNYQTDEEYQKQQIDHETGSLSHTIHLMDSLMISLPSTELAKPAIVSVQAADFTGFEDGHGDKMLIRVNNAWLNAGLGEEKPRFILITCLVDPSAGAANDLGNQLQKKFDGKQLKMLLDKE